MPKQALALQPTEAMMLPGEGKFLPLEAMNFGESGAACCGRQS